MKARFEMKRWPPLLLVVAPLLACAPTQAPRSAQERPRPIGSATATATPATEPAPALGPPQSSGEAHTHGHAQAHEHGHAHDHVASAAPSSATVTAHATLPSYENHGNTLRGIATRAIGAGHYEVWRTSVAVGGTTPLHRHESEEVFIFLQGKGKARIGDQEYTFEAPATVVAPANVPHQFFNIGNVPTDAIVVVGVGSKIWDGAGNEMQLPWRK